MAGLFCSPLRPPLQRLIRWLIALALVPLGLGGSWALLEVLLGSAAALDFWLALLGGIACWLLVFVWLPKPLWLYVVGHELTHAVWAWLFGGRVKSLKASTQGGHVILSKTNLLIALSPYFFPLYSIIWALLFFALQWLLPRTNLALGFHFGLGVTYAFHLTLTAHILRNRQPDIIGEGRIFSAVIIWLGNILVLLIAVPLLTGKVTLLAAFALALERTGQVIAAVGTLVRHSKL